MELKNYLVWLLTASLMLTLSCSDDPKSVDQTSEAIIDQSTQIQRYTVEEFLATTNYGGASFSPDNSKILVHNDQSGIYNLFSIPVNGGEPEQLTYSTTESIFSGGYFPNDERVLYINDEGGNELFHIFVRETDGTTRDLTPGEGHRAVFYGWFYDRSEFLIGTNERDQRMMDVYAYDPVTYERTLIFQNDDAYAFGGVSPNNRYIALAKVLSNADSDIYLYDLETEGIKLLTQHDGEINHFPAGFSPDGKLLYRTDANSEFMYPVEYDLISGEKKILAQPEWDVMFASYSHGGSYLAIGINNDAHTELILIDTDTGEPIELPQISDADIVTISISDDERMMALYATSSRLPRDLFVQALPDSEPMRLTRSLNTEIDPSMLVDGEIVRFESFDGLEVPGVLYKPQQASINHKVPAVVMVHGGPGGQARVGYNPLIQYLVNHGIAVYAINNRGSSGYGKTFYHLDDRAHGEGDLDDCVASKDMLIKTGYIDPNSIGIIGESYGGYMVLAALTFRPQAFDAGVDIFGISNWYHTVQNIPPWWESGRKSLTAELGDFDDEAYFRSISPIFHADKISRPLMVIQGANDPRVLKIESDEIVEAVRQNEVPVEYIVFDDEGHGFRKKENQAVAYRSIRDFLHTHLGVSEDED